MLSFATAFASRVLPVPGGPYSSTPFGASMPSFSNISGCLSGSSIISLTFLISSVRPPMSSYVTWGTPRRVSPFSAIVKTVFCVTSTASDAGATDMTWNVSLPPKYGTITLSPLISGTLSSASARYLSSMGGMGSSGATTTLSAAVAFIFLTIMVSPIAMPELFLPSPSILMIPLPSSDGYRGRHFATVRLFPFISMTSPVDALSVSMES